jgi:hypothetical protein
MSGPQNFNEVDAATLGATVTCGVAATDTKHVHGGHDWVVGAVQKMHGRRMHVVVAVLCALWAAVACCCGL